MTWDDFYERFCGLALSTQKSYASKLTDFGDADEVYEVLSEFAFHDQRFASRFAAKAMDGGVRFTPEQVLEMATTIEKSTLSRMAETAVPAFDREQLEEIYMLIDDGAFDRISKKQKIDIFAEDEADEPYEAEDDIEIIELPQKKPGFFATLFAVAVGVDLLESARKNRHNGRCNGDYAHCPPHYGYRYGRCYYGHDHQHGCEFGGNCGSMD